MPFRPPPSGEAEFAALYRAPRRIASQPGSSCPDPRGRLRPQDRKGKSGAGHAADPRQAGRRRQAALDHGPADDACICTATTSRRRWSRAQSPKWPSRPAPPDGSRSKHTSRTPRAATRMGRLRLSASRSIRASGVRPLWRLRRRVGAASCAPRRRARTASASATSCRCRSRSTSSARRRPSCSPSSSFGLFVRRAPAPACRPAHRPARHAARADGRPSDAVVLALQARRARACSSSRSSPAFGDQNPYRNIAPTLVWIIWWVGLRLRVGVRRRPLGARSIPGGPFSKRSNGSIGGSAVRGELGRCLPYPTALGVWPACAAAARLLLDRARLSESRPCRRTSPGWPSPIRY